MKTTQEPRHNDMAHVGWILALALIAGLVLAPLVWLFAPSPANAVVTSGYYVLTTLTRNYDTWNVTACSVFVLGGWNAGDIDSTRAYITYMADAPNSADAGLRDSLARFAIIPPSEFDQDYNPVFYAKWYVSGRTEPIRDDKPIVHMISYLDYLRTPVAAIADVNYDTLASIVNDTLTARHPGDWAATGSGGTGAFPETLFVYDLTSSGIVTGATLHIKTVDTSNYQNSSGPQPTGAGGYAVFSLDAGTFPVAVDAQGYFSPSAYQAITQSAPGGRDTVFMFSYTFTPPVAGMSQVVFSFYSASGDALESATLYYKLDIGSSVSAWTADSSVVIDPGEEHEAYADAFGVVTVNVMPNDSIYTDGYQTGKTRWKFWAKSPIGGSDLLGKDGIKVYVPTSGTPLVWPKDF